MSDINDFQNETSQALNEFINKFRTEIFKRSFALKLPVFQMSISFYLNKLELLKQFHTLIEFLK